MKGFCITIITSMICLCSCNSSSIKSTSPFCKNELALIGPDSGVQILQLDYKQSSDSLRSWILSQLDTVNCESFQSFGIKLSNEIILNANIEQFCGELRCFRTSGTRVLINKYGQLLFNDEWCELDSLSEQVVKAYSNSTSKDKYFRFVVHWSNNVPNNRVEKALVEITKGYIQVANLVANQKYMKGVCFLDAHQLSLIQKELTFKTWFMQPSNPPPPQL